jgi:hypothetical protein
VKDRILWTIDAPTRPGYYWFRDKYGKAEVYWVRRDGIGFYITGRESRIKAYVNNLVQNGAGCFSTEIPYPETQPPKEVEQPSKEVDNELST